MDIDFRPDRNGLKQLLLGGTFAGDINALANQIAANAQHTTQDGDELPIKVDHYTTDRNAASVTIAHPAGLATQAKYGTLTKAAAAVGLEVRSR